MSAPRLRKLQLYLAALNSPALPAAVLEPYLASGADISPPDYIGMIRRIAAAAPPDFALAFAAKRRLVEMGILGHAILSCGTLRRALTIWMDFSDLAGEPFRYQSAVSGQSWWIELHPAGPLTASGLRFHAEEFAVSFLQFARETTGYDGTGTQIEFQHPRQPGVVYETYLPTRPRFSTPRNRVTVPETVLDLPILSRDDELFDLLVTQFSARRAGHAAGSTAHHLRHLFMSTPGLDLKLTPAAARLGISARTLNRRLAEEGTSFTALLAEFRNDYAKALLREGTLGTKQIAHALGFRNHQSLRRAFAQWNGTAIGHWRREKS